MSLELVTELLAFVVSVHNVCYLKLLISYCNLAICKSGILYTTLYFLFECFLNPLWCVVCRQIFPGQSSSQVSATSRPSQSSSGSISPMRTSTANNQRFFQVGQERVLIMEM